MKKERKLKLEINKVCVSKLNTIKGGNLTESVGVLCANTIGPNTIPGEDCKTVVTIINGSLDKDC